MEETSALQYNHSPVGAERHTTEVPTSPGVHIFVPQAAASDEEEEDFSWVETADDNATTEERNMNQEGSSSTPDAHYQEGGEPYNEYEETPSQMDGYGTTQTQHYSPEELSGERGTPDEWEEVEEDDETAKETAGPNTLETVPVAEEQPEGPSPTADFEWITSAPSEEPSILTATSAEVALRAKTPRRATAGKSSVPVAAESTSSEALVIPNGLPPFTQGVQKGLSKLQEKTARRQHEVRTRIHAVECQMARWTADLATERMDRQESLQHFMAECVYDPAGTMIYRIALEKEIAQNVVDRVDDEKEDIDQSEDESSDGNLVEGQPRWRAAESRLNALETQMAQSAHALSKARREKLVSLHDRLIYDIMPRIWGERAAAAAQESLLMEQVDKLAGQCAARSMKERAAREATVAMADEQLQTSEVSYEERQKALLTILEDIRADLAREKEERKQQDEVMQHRVNEAMEGLRNALLEAVGDPLD